MMNRHIPIKKLLLMGRSKVGKTSMHAVIFGNSPPKDTIGIGFTVEINKLE